MLDDLYKTLSCSLSRELLGLAETEAGGLATSIDQTFKNSSNVGNLAREVIDIGKAALNAFLQANVTGPPLEWDVKELIPPKSLLSSKFQSREEINGELIAWLTSDGEAVYQLIPHVELFVFAKILLNSTSLQDATNLPRARLRVNTWHQRLLNQPSPTLQSLIYQDLEAVEKKFLNSPSEIKNEYACFLLERVTVHLLHGFDSKARADLKQAVEERSFQFVLTGRLGKRTKFQHKEVSQLVVLARSADNHANDNSTAHQRDVVQPSHASGTPSLQPQALSLNDDTLLESISFSKDHAATQDSQETSDLPPVLATLDPADQPLLDPLDAIILLDVASAITNTSPEDGLSREETLPYADRVLSGGSSNWQVYTQALLVRSRIEGYRTRTTERGVLQLQALVDQVVTETSTSAPQSTSKGVEQDTAISTFLPRPKQTESASAAERLRYIHQLASPPRWKLESELADRWVSLGALRTALEIYERLELWAEAALCLAAEGKETNARKIIRQRLYTSTKSDVKPQAMGVDTDDNVDDYIVERSPLPADSPRLFCILGDLEGSPSAYERAWSISTGRFARAQRSLGKYYSSKNETAKADEAYSKALKVNPQNHATWFALGCVRLLTENWSGAVDAFGRAVQIDDTDAESWSNLAVSLLRRPEDNSDYQKNLKGAFIAMKKATSLKRDNSKLWQNSMAIALQLSPPPYPEIVMAQSRLIELLGKSQGESAVDIPVVEALLAHVIDIGEVDEIGSNDRSASRGLRKLVIDLITKQIAPLITSSRPLWLLLAKLNLFLKRPLAALDTYEKAWRTALNQPGWESSKKQWKDVLDATIDLVDAYESLGERIRESGLGEGEVVAKDWKFKARSAARSVLARAKTNWEDDENYEVLKQRLDDLKAN